jgi:arginine exporter protein ArgO
MLATWTWNQLAYEIGICVAGVIFVACLGYLTRKGTAVVRKQRRFSLLDLLVAITLVGALAGMLRGMIGEDKNGMPFKLHGKIPNDQDIK